MSPFYTERPRNTRERVSHVEAPGSDDLLGTGGRQLGKSSMRGVWKTMGGWNEQQNPQKVEGSLLKAWDSDLPEWVTWSAAIY